MFQAVADKLVGPSRLPGHAFAAAGLNFFEESIRDMFCRRWSCLVLILFCFLSAASPGRAAGNFIVGQGSGETRKELHSSPAAAAGEEGKRWVLAVGICKFADTRIPGLKYCVADARSVVDYFRADGVPEERTILLTNEDADRQAIIRALTGIAAKIGPDDRFFFFFSSHGAGDTAGNTYFITFDTVLDDLPTTALPMQEVKKAVKGINCRDVVLLIDTCHSGGAKALERPNEKALDKLLRTANRRTRVAIMTSSRTHESSIESEELGHGAFTYYLLKGLAGKSDNFPRDGKVSVTELFDYVMVAVPRATDRAQHPSAKFSYNWPGKKDKAVKVGRVRGAGPADSAAGVRRYDAGMRPQDGDHLAPPLPAPAPGTGAGAAEAGGSVRDRWHNVVE